MNDRCNTTQIAEAIILWNLESCGGRYTFHGNYEDFSTLKYLDLIVSTVNLFSDAFDDDFLSIYGKYRKELPESKQVFVEFLKSRCLFLSEKNGYFELMLTCTFVSEIVNEFFNRFHCCHFSKVAYKCLLNILNGRFKEMIEGDSGWEELLSFCRRINAASYLIDRNRNSENYDSDEVQDSDSALANNNEQRDDNVDDESDSSEKPIFMCDVITDNSDHLASVIELIKKCENVDDQRPYPDEFDITISDDEEIQSLEVDGLESDSSSDTSSNSSPYKFILSDQAEKFMKEMYCGERSSDNKETNGPKLDIKATPSESFDKYVTDYFTDIFRNSDPSKHCKLCNGRHFQFAAMWRSKFHADFPNASSVSDFF